MQQGDETTVEDVQVIEGFKGVYNKEHLPIERFFKGGFNLGLSPALIHHYPLDFVELEILRPYHVVVIFKPSSALIKGFQRKDCLIL